MRMTSCQVEDRERRLGGGDTGHSHVVSVEDAFVLMDYAEWESVVRSWRCSDVDSGLAHKAESVEFSRRLM
jgi:hypothetical protein